MEMNEWTEKLEGFVKAHANATAGFNAAIGELQAGRKVGHWVWYIFPQLEGLGKSSVAQRFALADADEAWAYVAHPVLGARLAPGARDGRPAPRHPSRPDGGPARHQKARVVADALWLREPVSPLRPRCPARCPGPGGRGDVPAAAAKGGGRRTA